METLLQDLIGLGFTTLQAQIYMTLLTEGEQSGYQIAKVIGISRSSVYAALEGMYQKGIILKLNGEVASYIAQDPKILLAQMTQSFREHIDSAETQLSGLYDDRREERYTNIHGFDSIVSSARNALLNAKKEVYLNTDFDLSLFSNEFNILAKRNVRILVFSFATLETKDLPIEFYSHEDSQCEEEKPSRLMLVIDCDQALVADTYKKRGSWLGTITNNALFVSIVAEHIHHDIYLLRLKQERQREVITESIKLHTLLENK
ncbi:helix-turn-helix domain-containing protein [uncultured Sphaerochaeta sp.]|uniref:TrmB family transcriptional regulator n=1 Tax=uncultured Sphaerochaeta sp. TaxID=886478 RepID=UPI002A0A2756|nr:helix-turn-helix domain-containing protein [uncultured Sphaerochaeta sp.]